MYRNNISAQSVASTVAPTSTAGSSSIGTLAGTRQSSQASTEAFQEVGTTERDSLLNIINYLLDAENNEQARPLGLDLAPEVLQDILGLTRGAAASSAKGVRQNKVYV